jgi:hypothetical protein
MPEYFTAISGNGATSNPVAGSAVSVIPMYLSMAENDNGNPYLSNPGGLRNLVTYWLNRNGGLGVVDSPDETQSGVGPLERIFLYKWNDAQGVPLFMYSITAARNHNVSVDTNWTAWEEWFSKWRKDAAGNLYYENRLVQGAVTSPLVTQQAVPSVLNLKTLAGVATVVLRTDVGDLALWNVSNVRLEGAAALSVSKSSDGRTLVAVFRKSDLAMLPAGNAVSVTATGQVERDGMVNPFTATATLRILK